MRATSKHIKETKQFVAKVLKGLRPDKIGATILALSGDLGSGKTTFTQLLAHLLKIKETVNSPTFVIMKKYAILNSPYTTLVHIDAYRLESPQELEHLGWKELVSDPSNLIVVEWAEKVREILPKNVHWFYFEFVDDTTRKMKTKND